jgi:hypothetical protein
MSLISLLRQRHSKDVFVPECKDGPSMTGTHRRMDAWAMARSWSHPCFYGYEIKHDRGDFIRDKKWHDYLPLCNEFYFVTHKIGIIDPKELPDEVGLLIAASTGTRLITKKVAPRRPIEPPVQLLLYILMSRADIDGPAAGGNESPSLEHWKEWLARKEEKQDIGYKVSKALSARYRKDVTNLQAKNA